MIYYSSELKLGQLKARCRERGLKVGGKKGELVSRLRLEDEESDLGRQLVSRCAILLYSG